MATEEEKAVRDKILDDPWMRPLAECLAALFEKEFGHVLKAGESGEAWKMVACNFVDTLGFAYRPKVDGWHLNADDVVDLTKLLQQHNKEAAERRDQEDQEFINQLKESRQ